MASANIAKALSVSKPNILPQSSDVEASRYAKNATDIEHVPVHDDPRQWSRVRKVSVEHITSPALST
jgi:hypothetical protein